MTGKKLTIKEFAAQLEVSTATVSRAFSTRGRISDVTREMIITKAAELGYHANIHASNLSRRGSSTIALFYPAISNNEPDYFITELLLGINETLHHTGKMLQIHPFYNGSNMAFFRDYILSGVFSGIIIVAGTNGSKELLSLAKTANLPYIVIGHMSTESSRTVVFDNEGGAYQAGKYLRQTGREHPVYVSGHLDRRKKKGLRSGLGALAEKLILFDGGSSLADGKRALRTIMQQQPQTDAILCANDVLALGILKAAHELKIAIPEQLAVIGFDNIKMSGYSHPALSTVSLNLFRAGEIAVKQLIKLIDSTEQLRPIKIESELIIRESA
ncbi:MAG: LacI family transcriptional regulator [Victivallaceae bacterium]|nr:LacI family transcriptional regulator [Victivallaceae bacterium]